MSQASPPNRGSGRMEVGVCSWSLDVPAEPAALAAECRALGVRSVQLALRHLTELPADQRAAAIAVLRARGVRFSAGMFGFAGEDYSTFATIRRTGGYVPEDQFPKRLQHSLDSAQVAHDLGLTLLSTHAGFIPPPADTAAFNGLVGRLRQVLAGLAPLGITLLFETGQETADTLAAFLTAVDRPNAGVNFDPANMLLYGKGDPLKAVLRLAPWIRHVHAKDALITRPVPTDPDTWCGHEVPVGKGDVRFPELITLLKRSGFTGTLAIEREGGAQRRQDIIQTITALRSWIDESEER